MTVALAVLAVLVPGPCGHRRFTVHASARGIRATFHGDQPLSKQARRRVRRYLACTSTNAHGHRFLRGLVARQRHALAVRVADARVTPYMGPDGRRWAIPWPIVYCESRGENLPPNSDGASSPYQIVPGTWAANGGLRYAPQAYLAPRFAQDLIASRIWDGNRGASQWACAFITGWL